MCTGSKEVSWVVLTVGSRSRELIIRLYSTLITLHLAYCVLFCPLPSTGKTLIKWKEFSRGSPGQLGLEHSPCEKKLRDQDWLRLQKRQLREHLTAAPQHLWGCYESASARLFTS